MAARGLKTRIAFNVALLLLLSALITDILVVVVVQNVMVRDAIDDIKNSTISNASNYFAINAVNPVRRNPAFDLSHSLTSRLWQHASLVIMDRRGTILFQHQNASYPIARHAPVSDAAINRTRPVIEETGITWAVFWWHPEAVTIKMPILKDATPLGIAVVRMPLIPIYEKLRNFNKPIFLYIAINTAILTLVGLYRIFRLYLRPIDRIVRQADEFQDDEDLLFAFRNEDNELNRLSISLNQMLSRISSDKNKLRQSVESLERTNRELQNAQREIISAEKLASVGRLAAGIAHEIGNPIGIVLGYLEMLKDDDLDAEEKSDFLMRTEKEVQRINRVIRQLLDLARPQSTNAQQVALHDVLEEIVEVMRLQPIMKDIRLELDLEAKSDGVSCNQDQFRQVFLNLMLNAADAIHSKNSPRTGRIRIATRVACTEDETRRPCFQIRITDNGTGIDAEQLQNIFDPFYSTKEPGKGTGLGLSVSYMIIEGAGGNMFAESPADGGAVFTIELPLAQQA